MHKICENMSFLNFDDVKPWSEITTDEKTLAYNDAKEHMSDTTIEELATAEERLREEALRDGYPFVSTSRHQSWHFFKETVER